VRRWIALALGLAVALAAGIALREGRDARVLVPPPEQGAQTRGEAAPIPSETTPGAALPPGAGLPPEARRYHELRTLQEEVRAFFGEQHELPAAERDVRAAALRKQVEERQRDGLLSPQEALLLELGLLEASLDDPAVYEHEARELIEKRQEEAERRRSEASGGPDPRFETYKRREAEVVREVMALEEIPGGRPRGEYLRERLQRVRSEVYGGGADEAAPR
jgi:hypothetical protein